MKDLVGLLPPSMPLDNDILHDATTPGDMPTRIAVRNRIAAVEDALREMTGKETGDKDEIDANGLKHHHMPGVYVRELFIPKDMVVVSQLHKKVRMWIIAQGEVTFRTEYGARHVKAPYTEIVEPWSKVALFTHEDTVWFAIHRADGVTQDELEAELIAVEWPNEVAS